MNEVIIDESKMLEPDQLRTLLNTAFRKSTHLSSFPSRWEDALEDVDVPTRIVFKAAYPTHRPWWDEAVQVIRDAQADNDFIELFVYDDDLDVHDFDLSSELDAPQALAALKRGNTRYLEASHAQGDISADTIEHLFSNGQHPYAVIVSCADSRVVPEHLFMTGLGELFTIRVAGNVIDKAAMASIVYACSHLHVKLVLVLGHTNCGAIEAAMEGTHSEALAPLTKPIARAIGDEKDPYVASALNVKAAICHIVSNGELYTLMNNEGLEVHGAVYHTHSGVVDFLD